MPSDLPIREPDEIRKSAASKLRAVEVSDHFRAILGCLLEEDWTTPRLVEMVITPDGHLTGRCDGEAAFKAFLGASEDLIKNIHGVAPVAELDGDEIGYLVGKVAEIKRRGSSDVPSKLDWQCIVADESWYRRRTWTDEDRAGFFARLRRSRSGFHKAQYCRIQAYELQQAGNYHAALELLDLLMKEWPDDAQKAAVFH
jgi:hypothetical protein